MRGRPHGTRLCATAGKTNALLMAALVVIGVGAIGAILWFGTAPAEPKPKTGTKVAAPSHPVDLEAQAKRREEGRRWGLIYRAATTDEPKVLEDLAAQGVDLDAAGEFGNTPLMMAALHSAVRAAEYLVAHGADVNARNERNVTPLDQAVTSGSQPIARLLLDKGAKLDICAAAGLGRKDDVARMLAQDPKLIDAQVDGNPPLFWAARAGQADVVQALLDAGADVNARNANGETALLMAVGGNSPESAAVLLKKGANAGLTAGRVGLTPLDQASSAAMIDALVKGGARLEARNGRGQTALQWKVFAKQPDLVGSLIDHGADTNVQDGAGDTPLHQAARAGELKVVQVLVEKGASLGAKDKAGLTPLELAQKAGHADVAEFLSQAAAKHGP